MKYLVLSVLGLAAVSAAPSSQTFIGIISDDMCGADGHAFMRMGPTDAECVKACVMMHGAEYVLVTGQKAYVLSDQKTPERFAGQKVTVIGSLDAKGRVIQVDSIAAAK